MAFVRNKKSSNPNFGKKLTVANMSHPILNENKKVLALLEEMDKKKCRDFRKKGDKKV